MTALALGVAALVAVGGYLLASRLGPAPQPRTETRLVQVGNQIVVVQVQQDSTVAASAQDARSNTLRLGARRPRRRLRARRRAGLAGRRAPPAAACSTSRRSSSACDGPGHRRAGRHGRAGRARRPRRRPRPHARPLGGEPPRAGATPPRGRARAPDAAGGGHHQPRAGPAQPPADRRRRAPGSTPGAAPWSAWAAPSTSSPPTVVSRWPRRPTRPTAIRRPARRPARSTWPPRRPP